MAKQSISTAKTSTKSSTRVTIKSKLTSSTSKTNGSKRCPTCGKFMK